MSTTIFLPLLDYIVVLPIQLGLLVDKVHLASPICIAMGIGCILWWGIDTMLLTGLIKVGNTPGEQVFRTIVSLSLVFGTLTAFAALSLSYTTFWSLISILYLLGRLLEGAVIVILIRKIHRFISQSRSSRRSIRESLTRKFMKLLRRWRFLLIGALLVTLATIVFGVLWTSLYGFSLRVVALMWAIFVGGNIVWGLTWNLRRLLLPQTPLTVTKLAVVGTFFYIVGTELAAFPDHVPLPLQPLVPAADWITPFSREVIREMFSISLLARTLTIAGSFAAILGAVIAVSLWYIDQPWKRNTTG